MEYVEFDRETTRKMLAHVDVELSNFVPVKALRDGIAIVGLVDIDMVYKLNNATVNIAIEKCELLVDFAESEFQLMPELAISTELRAALTIKVSEALSEKLCDAIRSCADWIEATNGAPDGFIGDTYDPDAEASDEENLTAGRSEV